MSEDNEWYVIIAGEQQGPFDGDAVMQMMNKGRIDHQTMVWHVGMVDWTFLSEVDHFPSHPRNQMQTGDITERPNSEYFVFSKKAFKEIRWVILFYYIFLIITAIWMTVAGFQGEHMGCTGCFIFGFVWSVFSSPYLMAAYIFEKKLIHLYRYQNAFDQIEMIKKLPVKVFLVVCISAVASALFFRLVSVYIVDFGSIIGFVIALFTSLLSFAIICSAMLLKS